jgi:hypothetical protein
MCADSTPCRWRPVGALLVAGWRPPRGCWATAPPKPRRPPCTTTASLSLSPKVASPICRAPRLQRAHRVASSPSPPPPSRPGPRARRNRRPSADRRARPAHARRRHPGQCARRRGAPASPPERDAALDHVHQSARQVARPRRRSGPSLARRPAETPARPAWPPAGRALFDLNAGLGRETEIGAAAFRRCGRFAGGEPTPAADDDQEPRSRLRLLHEKRKSRSRDSVRGCHCTRCAG